MTRTALLLSLSLSLCATVPGRAQTPGHAHLFPDSLTVPAEDDRRAIYDRFAELTGVVPATDGSGLVAPDCGVIFTTSQVADLDEDGASEVFLLAGNTCTSGMAGSSLWLFRKDEDGAWAHHLGFPAGGWTALETTNEGLPDLAIGGPGFCEAVYRWDGTTYQHHGERETAAGGCEGY